MASDRIFLDDDARWYFKVRGNQVRGPFASEAEAEHALEEYVAACQARLEPRLLNFDLSGLRLIRRNNGSPLHSR
ncbi:MAG: DUF6316 family protein [Pseudomonadales bacterium]